LLRRASKFARGDPCLALSGDRRARAVRRPESPRRNIAAEMRTAPVPRPRDFLRLHRCHGADRLRLCAAKERSSDAPVPPRVWVSAGGRRHGPDAVAPSVASGCRPGEVKLLPFSSSHSSLPATRDRRLRPARLPMCSVSVRPSVRAHPSSRPCGFVAVETPRCSST
jgi:hypothetical protein